MKVLISILIGLMVVGCGKDEAEKTNSEGANSISDDANSHSKYKEELAKIKSLSEPTTLADLNTWHKAVPAEENSALAYLEARKSLPENSGKLSTDHLKAYSKARRSKNFNPSAIRIHPSLLPSVRANLIGHNVHINQLLNFYATSPANQPARFDWNNRLSTFPTHLASLKFDVRLLGMRSRIFADAGHTGEAIRSILAAHRLAHLLNSEPCLISELLQQSLYSSADAQIERLLNQFALNDAQLVTLHQSIASFNVPAQYANALIGNRCQGIAEEEAFRNGSSTEIQYIHEYGVRPFEKELAQQIKNRSEADRDADMSVYLEFHNSAIKLFKSGYPQLPASHEKYSENVKTLARMSELQELFSDKSNSIYIYSRSLFTVPATKCHQWSLMQQLAGTAMAIERYRLANRTLPQSLNQLVPQFLSALPLDPYSEGKTLRYVAGANGSFMLSSIESDNQKPKHPHPAPDIYTFGVNPALRGR